MQFFGTPVRRSTVWRLGAAAALSAVLVACGGGGGVETSREQALAVTGTALSGAIFTTDSACSGVDLNIYGSKDLVYLDGGPRKAGSAGLPDGYYWVKVTTPDGDLLGSSTSANVHVVGGEFVGPCYQLSTMLVKATDATPGYDDTTNAGGEYKAWISQNPAFPNDESKTDNFKVKAVADCGTDPSLYPAPYGTLVVKKFYDANADGVFNGSDVWLPDWKVGISDISSDPYYTEVTVLVGPGDYSVNEFMPVETNWMATTPSPVTATVDADATTTVEFGNVCVGAGGGLTLGFWSNRNGQALFGADDLALMGSLNLRNANGTAFNPASYSSFKSWLLSATATNMAYMLSAQLAAMELNVLNGKVSGTALVYAPGATSANGLGYATINALMAEADASLGTDGYTVASGATRSYQEALKNALDRANNNLNFVQGTPCAYSFAS